ncbi:MULTISPECIES: hypothetical protein [unclassified Bradyrhizobium]|uniref:hypothetical protein n=1 Tax=unclassified Bradyrhizobium TaxID=2631580 RepID=UPI0029171459|nr:MULTISPECIES: hypothetical protein [unclassified Bradyrhizobium]
MDPRVQKKLELLEAEGAVAPEVRRRIAKDNSGMWIAGIVLILVIGWLAHGNY